MLRCGLLPFLLLAASCTAPDRRTPSPAPGEAERRLAAAASGDAAVDAFVRREHPDAYARLRFRSPAHDLVFFEAQGPMGDFGDSWSRTGLRYREMIGWIPYDSADARPRTFPLPADDPFFHSLALARMLDSAGIGWGYPFGPWLASHPGTPVEALRLATAAPALHPLLLRHAKVAEDLETLSRLSRSPSLTHEEWRAVALPRLERVLQDAGADTVYLRLLLTTLDRGAPRVELAARLARHPVVRRDSALLIRLYWLGNEAYRPVRREVVDGLLAMHPVPETLWRQLEWWESHPALYRDTRLRGRHDVLMRMRQMADPLRFATERAAVDRMLLADTSLDAASAYEIALTASGAGRRCRPLPYPVEEIAMAALRHPRARESQNIPAALVYLYEHPRVRARAYRMLTGQEIATGDLAPRPRADLPRLRGAFTVSLGWVDRVEDWRGPVMRVIHRWQRQGRHPEEAAEWARIIATSASSEAIHRAVGRDAARVERLLRANPLLVLLPPEELDGLGLACDLLDR